MSKVIHFVELKSRATQLGKRIGEFIVSSVAPRETKMAVAALLPHVRPVDLNFVDEKLTADIRDLHQAAASGNVDGPADESTLALLLHELLVRSAHQVVSPHDELPTVQQAREQLSGGQSQTVDDHQLVQQALAEFFRHENDFISQDPVLQQPPTTAWDGPQPGLTHQADARHRYNFSAQTGYLESIIAYDSAGTPAVRVQYRLDAQSGKPVRDTCEMSASTTQDAWVCVSEDGSEQPITGDAGNMYVTPSGVVVLIIEHGTLWRRPRAQYVGRLKQFDPMKPFVMRTSYGTAPLPMDSARHVMSTDGSVYETTSDGLRRVGELISDKEAPDVQLAQPITIDHDHITVALQPQEDGNHQLTVKIKHQELAMLLNGALHRVIGRHPFFHEHIPEMIDMHGGVAAEEALRELERLAAHTGLVMRVIKEDSRMEVRAALLHAHRQLEERLWQKARALEELLGSESQHMLHFPSIRAWIAMAAQDPDRAAADLRRMATPVASYAA